MSESNLTLLSWHQVLHPYHRGQCPLIQPFVVLANKSALRHPITISIIAVDSGIPDDGANADGQGKSRCSVLWQPRKEHEWEEVLCSLAAKGEALPLFVPNGGGNDSYLWSMRKEEVDWPARAAAIHYFSVLTVLLAVSYFDRCFLAACTSGGGRRVRIRDQDRQADGASGALRSGMEDESHSPSLFHPPPSSPDLFTK
ncbi:hypothetical protein Cni_G16589 [Canna indica]|uniref:Uncharacterized protein n=1 Tax=Canna indica TaxID=4628 RepID=A0AAQ3KFI6_9LILI|nr:hypothetical protein Cni_G16589 [Canna indica]